jgi:hypothetical protein
LFVILEFLQMEATLLGRHTSGAAGPACGDFREQGAKFKAPISPHVSKIVDFISCRIV